MIRRSVVSPQPKGPPPNLKDVPFKACPAKLVARIQARVSTTDQRIYGRPTEKADENTPGEAFSRVPQRNMCIIRLPSAVAGYVDVSANLPTAACHDYSRAGKADCTDCRTIADPHDGRGFFDHECSSTQSIHTSASSSISKLHPAESTNEQAPLLHVQRTRFHWSTGTWASRRRTGTTGIQLNNTEGCGKTTARRSSKSDSTPKREFRRVFSETASNCIMKNLWFGQTRTRFPSRSILLSLNQANTSVISSTPISPISFVAHFRALADACIWHPRRREDELWKIHVARKGDLLGEDLTYHPPSQTKQRTSGLGESSSLAAPAAASASSAPKWKARPNI
eukprot:2686368-Amphidinium_carterae.3